MRRVSALLASLALPLFVSGCTSLDEDANVSRADAAAPARLDSAEAVARTAAYLRLVMALDQTGEHFATLPAPGGSKAAAAKLTVEDDCVGGGRFGYSDEESDGNPDDFRLYVFDHCIDSGNNRLHGRLQLDCLNGRFDDSDPDSCRNTRLNLGEANAPITAEAANADRVSLQGVWRIESTQGTTISEQSLVVEARSGSAQQHYLGLLEDFRRDLEASGDGTLAAINGDIGVDFSGDDADCQSGRVNFTTLERLAISATGRFEAGRLRLNNGDSRSATVEFDTSGGISVTLDGATTGFPRSRFESFCALD